MITESNRPPRRRDERPRRAPAVLAVLTTAGLVIGGGYALHLRGGGEPAPAPPIVAAEVTRETPTRPPARTRRLGPVVNGRRQPLKVAIPARASGRYAVVPGTSRPPRRARQGMTLRYIVEVERGLPLRGREFAAAVHRILNDPRGWGHRFHRVSRGAADLRVSLSSPALATRNCLPLEVGGQLSCWQRGRAVINARRWAQGAATYGHDIATYREYVISHEVGHGLGHGHGTCPGPGRAAPVMVQQTKSLSGCRPNPWPHPSRS
jgi:uncharacterized protein DUF3152